MISVIMPVYNGADFLQETINSVLSQTEKDFELIIINDGSTDNSEAIIKAVKDSRIKYFKQENSGPSAARNVGLEAAKGDFIVIQDADDISLPTRFEVLKRQFIAPNIGIAHSDVLLINEKSQPFGYWASQNLDRKRMLRFFLKIGTPFNNNSMMIRREAIKNMRFDPVLRVGEDTEFVFRITNQWDSIHVPEPLLLYRRHAGSLSTARDYQILFTHLQKFLQAHSLIELVPELNWEGEDTLINNIIATALISLFLFRRGAVYDGKQWYEKAREISQGQPFSFFVDTIGAMLIGNYSQAIDQLSTARCQNHITENYLGESYALSGQKEKAYQHFLKALELFPGYQEPLENIKAIGLGLGYAFIDRSWHKFP